MTDNRSHLLKIGQKTRFKKGHEGYKGMLGKKHNQGVKKTMSEIKKEFYKTHDCHWKGKKRENISGERHWNWKGGRTIDVNGYYVVPAKNHKNKKKNGYILEHRLVMSKKIGRPLLDDEVVHHKDGNKLNNKISNLELHTRKTHMKLHDYHRKRDKLGRYTSI